MYLSNEAKDCIVTLVTTFLLLLMIFSIPLLICGVEYLWGLIFLDCLITGILGIVMFCEKGEE